MLEFAREQWLWLFALVGVFFVAWWFARRYRKQRVTYGRIWDRVAKRVLPPGWKRVLRTVITLLISGVMLSAVVLYTAGLQRPAGDQPAPLLVFILIDNSPAMRASQSDTTRAELAQKRAQEIVNALGEHDRAAIVWKQSGQILVGPWLKPNESVANKPATDWLLPVADSTQSDLQSIPPPPGMPAELTPERVIFRLGNRGSMKQIDKPLPASDLSARLAGSGSWQRLMGLPCAIESFGEDTTNNGFTMATYTPPEPNDDTGGVIRFKTTSPASIEAIELNELKILSVDPAPGHAGMQQVVLPQQAEPLHVKIRLARPDALPQDDTLELTLQPRQLSTVTLCYPASEDRPNWFLKRTLELLLPGREIIEHQVQPGDHVKADLIVCDRALPDGHDAHFLLCFGILPAEYGTTAAPVDAVPNLQLRVEPPDELGFELPEMTLLQGEGAVPLQPGHALTPLAKLLSGETLIGIQRDQPELLYVGFLPHESTFLQESGSLLLLRWLTAMQSGHRIEFPPFVAGATQTEIQLSEPADLRIEITPDNAWLPSFGPKAYTVTSGADGRAVIGPFVIPGRYSVSRGGKQVTEFTVVSDLRADLSGSDGNRIELDRLFKPATQPDWRDYLPGVLLWIALVAMLLEWLLWLVGVTE